MADVNKANFFGPAAKNIFLPEAELVVTGRSGRMPRAEKAVVFNGAVMVIAGLALASGIAPKLAATVLIGSLVPTTVVGHAFWKEETVAGRKNQLTQFFKNLGLIGGLMLVLQEK